MTAGRARAIPEPTLPSAQVLADDVAAMVGFGPRYPGSAGHAAWVDHMQDVFERHGVRVTRDRFGFDRWSPAHSALSIDTGADAGAVAVAGPYPNSGATGPGGIEGQLTYLGPVTVPDIGDIAGGDLQRVQRDIDTAVSTALSAIPGGVAGRIVVVENPVAPLTIGAFDPLLSYRHDPDHTIDPSDNYARVWTTLLTTTTLTAFRTAGAAAAVLLLDAAPANAAGQYTPFNRPYQDFPALIVDREQAARIRRAATEGARARLILQATVERADSDSLVGILPGSGRSTEAVIVHTHTDGMNAFEENGSLAQLHLAAHLGARGTENRDRDIVFSAVTGHFGPGLPETQGFLDHHRDLVDRAVAAVTIEHFGTTEWLDDPTGYHPTGRVEPTVAFHTPTGILDHAIAATQDTDLRRFELLEPIGTTFFGVGARLNAAGIPSIAYLGGPNYLCAEAPNGHLDKLDPTRMSTEITWTANLLDRLDTAPAEQLRH
jgi:hypothetical protein